VVGFVFLDYYSSDHSGDKKLDELALGDETSVSFKEVGGSTIHCQYISDGQRCLDDYKKASKDKVVLWLGNSQLHSVNQMQPDDETATAQLHRKLRDSGYYLMTFSQPNAGLQEHYALFEYLSINAPVSILVLPVVFDDMRETGIRSELFSVFKDEAVTKRLETTEVGRVLLKNHSEQDAAGNDMAALNDTVQEKSEKSLNKSLESLSSIWADRPGLRARLSLSMYRFRNWIFDINPASIRKIIPGRYVMNKMAMKAILKSSAERDIKVILYIAPLRNDVNVPYDLNEYDKFKVEIRSIADEFNIGFVNLEKLVPGEYWGTKGSTTTSGVQEIDFMHFQANGHKLLGDAVYSEIQKITDPKSMK